MPSGVLITHILTAALRDRMILALLLVFAVVASLSLFLGGAAVIEKDQFTFVFAAFSLRLIGVLGLVLFVVSFIRRSFDRQDIDFILSYPISRAQFLSSSSLGFVVVALIVSIAQSLGIWVLSGMAFSSGWAVWSLSILAENIIMVLVAQFFAMVLGTIVLSALSCFGFYILGRLMGQILGNIAAGLHFVGAELTAGIMNVISVFVPRLDLLGQSSWLVYGVDGALPPLMLVAQLFAFVAILFTATLIDLQKRSF